MGCGASTAHAATKPAGVQPTTVRRLMVYASDTPDKADFVASLASFVTAIEFDVETATASSLINLVENAKLENGGEFASVAFACHGAGSTSGFKWTISKALVVEGGKIGDDVTSVMKALGKATLPGGRVDLFACSLLKTAEGTAVFEAIQKDTDAHFAASDDLTGNARGQGLQDWVMESDGVNVKPLYFGDTAKFDGNFGGAMYVCPACIQGVRSLVCSSLILCAPSAQA